MSETPVERIVVTHPRLGGSVSVEIPWNLFPEAMRARLDRLDSNDDGAISYSPTSGTEGADSYVEARHSDPSASLLTRLLWRFGGRGCG